MRLILTLVWIIVATGCATVRPAPAVEPPEMTPVEAWSLVLAHFVDDRGRVAFDRLKHDPRDLNRFVAWVYAVGPNNHPELFPRREDKLAYHLNAYNALAMWNMLKAGVPRELGGLARFSFFWRDRIEVGGERMSLYAYENDVIRPLGEPRVHFALNCMARGCPHLPRKPFRGDILDGQLDREARQFFAEHRNLSVSEDEQSVYVSQILEWFEEDFLTAAPSLIAYINRYAPRPVPEDYELAFIPYDWRVARQ